MSLVHAQHQDLVQGGDGAQGSSAGHCYGVRHAQGQLHALAGAQVATDGVHRQPGPGDGDIPQLGHKVPVSQHGAGVGEGDAGGLVHAQHDVAHVQRIAREGHHRHGVPLQREQVRLDLLQHPPPLTLRPLPHRHIQQRMHRLVVGGQLVTRAAVVHESDTVRLLRASAPEHPVAPGRGSVLLVGAVVVHVLPRDELVRGHKVDVALHEAAEGTARLPHHVQLVQGAQALKRRLVARLAGPGQLQHLRHAEAGVDAVV